MGKKRIDFSYKVRGDFSPNGLQKVFLSFHPEDSAQMKKFADDILNISDCAIWYHTDSLTAEETDLEDLELKLGEMRLFVVVVTTNYLLCDSLAKNWEYAFAMEHHIPILPIAAETGLEEYFAMEMNRVGHGYGDIQLLRSQVTDWTEIPYDQKLMRALRAILVADTEIERIKQAFSGRIFLSYRKKDRRYANELMRTIHNIPSLRNVSIWFDEFMSSGEKWSEQIEEALKKSDVFLLMVSPSITEPDNYVIREEYPAARKQDKKIVSVRMDEENAEALDIEELRKIFPGLRVLVDGDDADELESVLQELASDEASTPETDYLIGLAFFTGIEVECDIEKAVSLIVASARQNLPEAVQMLAEMYWEGAGISVNYENSISWRKRLVELYERKLPEITDPEEILKYLRSLESLAVCLYELSSFRDSLLYARRLAKRMEQQPASVSQDPDFLYYRAQAHDLCGRNCKRLGLYEEAVVYGDKYRKLAENRYKQEPSANNLHGISVAYERVGDVYYAMGDFRQAEVWYRRALEINRRMDEQLQSAESAFAVSVSLLVLGDIHIRRKEYEKSEPMYAEAVFLRKRIAAAEDTDEHKKAYAEAVLARGTALMMMGETDEADRIFSEAKEIYRNLAEKYGTLESQHAYSVALNRCGAICKEKSDFIQACEYYEDSLKIRRKILSKVRSSEAVYECALAVFYQAGAKRQFYGGTRSKEDYEEIVEMLLPVLTKDGKGDFHRIFVQAAFDRFQIDTYSGKRYLQFAIEGSKWLSDRQPENLLYQKQYELYRKMYQRCYPD